ncbi:MAG: Bifunctional purine biosynthesis protein PurH [Syntrophorhabdaceae bacterium PtaU1.Bin034]|jgi:phosphoribosylaminoimidazolecarboxamide formyltransferase/IMP cyclohydrolase|nr:MAG: Bifunctional purine biosynthesis protein PurH [Syntrophorhabdaceae bacterium PtaU1.Bin034]
MGEIKEMYKKVVKDKFPDTIKIDMGGQVLEYRKKVWSIYDADENADVERGLRYGENPDQPAALYELINGNIVLGDVRFFDFDGGLVSRITEKDQLQVGKHPGKINLTDVDNALNILRFLDRKPACSIMKHNNPCGTAYGSTSAEAFEKAFWCDRIAAFGGAVVLTRTVDVETARAMAPYYFEVVCAPDFEGAAIDILRKWKNLRILQIREIERLQKFKTKRIIDLKSLMDGGLVIQESQPFTIKGREDLKPAQATYKGEVYRINRAPTEKELQDMLFGWYVESGVSSNSALFVKDEATVAIGTGEQDRVGVVEIATFKAYTKFLDAQVFKKFGVPYAIFRLEAERGERRMEDLRELEDYTKAEKAGLKGSIIVSDGFFPFRDGVDAAIKEGATGVIQPGGSERDFETITACNEANVTMVFTGQRLFKH